MRTITTDNKIAHYKPRVKLLYRQQKALLSRLLSTFMVFTLYVSRNRNSAKNHGHEIGSIESRFDYHSLM